MARRVTKREIGRFRSQYGVEGARRLLGVRRSQLPQLTNVKARNLGYKNTEDLIRSVLSKLKKPLPEKSSLATTTKSKDFSKFVSTPNRKSRVIGRSRVKSRSQRTKELVRKGLSRSLASQISLAEARGRKITNLNPSQARSLKNRGIRTKE